MVFEISKFIELADIRHAVMLAKTRTPRNSKKPNVMIDYDVMINDNDCIGNWQFPVTFGGPFCFGS